MNTDKKEQRFPANESYCWILYKDKWQIVRFQRNEYTGHTCFVLIEDKGGFPIIGFYAVEKWVEIANPQFVPPDLKNVVCPQCKEKFKLMWNNYSDTPQTVFVRACPSGGVYDLSFHCPKCDYEEQL